ncbi:putative phage protein [Pseudomonas syringae pv. maculicola]|nr:putative phage protein [Pseudomonas syringae pv. maculicola]
MGIRMDELLINGGTERIRVNKIPDFCPICHVGIEPKFVTGLTCSDHDEVNILFTCPKLICKKMFIATYQNDQFRNIYNIKSLLPRTPKTASMAQEVAEISPQFEEIYNQAFQAEAYGLGEVAGVGYRKSLEYLIKDYCTAQYPDKDEDIKSVLLLK